MPESRPGAAGLPSASRTHAAGSPPASSRSAATNRPASRWNANTPTGRRCRDLYKAYLGQLGNSADPATQAAILSAAEQIVISELARAECLADGGLTKINLEMVIRAENLASRTLRRLKLDKPVAAPRKSFVEKMQEQEARQAVEARAAEGAA